MLIDARDPVAVFAGLAARAREAPARFEGHGSQIAPQSPTRIWTLS